MSPLCIPSRTDLQNAWYRPSRIRYDEEGEDPYLGILSCRTHRTKYQESVNGNVTEICETVAETRLLTHVSAVGLVTFTRVSVAAVTAEP